MTETHIAIGKEAEALGNYNQAFELQPTYGSHVEHKHNHDSTLNEAEKDVSQNAPQQNQRGIYRSYGLCYPLHLILDLIEDNSKKWYENNKTEAKICFLAILIGGYTAYFLAACIKDFKRAYDLFGITMFALFCAIYWLVKKTYGIAIYDNILEPIANFVRDRWRIFKWGFISLVVILIILWIGIDTAKDPPRLMSLVGLLVQLLLCFVISKHRRKINWRPVLWGLLLQFVFGILILRTEPGFKVFNWLGDRATIFLNFSDHGAKFLFGETQYLAHFFAFKVLPVVVFFSAAVSVMYYLGWMEIIIKKIAWLIQVTMGTSAAESLNAAGNIFIGQTEAPLLIRPFLETMTLSELHAVMTGGFATIAGSVLGAYIAFGVSPSHLLSASVMSAPAALAVSKLMYPETEESKTKNVDDVVIEKGDERNFVDALAKGASMSITLVANIAVMLIAALATKRFINAMLLWLGSLVDIEGLTLEKICSYVLMPLAYLMGVRWEDAFEVGELLGIKTLVNEFVAYDKLGKFITNRKSGIGATLSIRSEIIATYALCGFSNIGSVGIQIGGIGAIAPSRRGDLASIAIRALVAGTIACFMTACIAGVLYKDESSVAAQTKLLSTAAAAVLNVTTTAKP